MAADRIRVAEVFLSEEFVDHSNPGGSRHVTFPNLPAEQNRNLHSGKEGWTHLEKGSSGLPAGGWRHAGNSDAHVTAGIGDQRKIGETQVPDSWNFPEPSPQVGVELDHSRILVSSLPGIQAKKQYVFAIEAEVDCMEIGKRPNEKTG